MPRKKQDIAGAYSEVVKGWRRQNLRSRDQFAEALSDFLILFSYHSGRIENPRISYHDTRDVFEHGRARGFSGEVRTLFEIQNLKCCHEQMLGELASRKPISEKMVLEFHRMLTQGTYDERRWAQGERPGEYKHHDYVVGVHGAGALAQEVPGLVRSLVQELDVVNESNVLTAASYFHLVFESIHPFADGNGRCGRALTNYLLMLHGHPPVIVFDEDKLAYYGALEVWELEADLAPMEAFMKAETVKTWVGKRSGSSKDLP